MAKPLTTSTGSRDFTFQSDHDGRDGSGRDQIIRGVGMLVREMGWDAALRSKLCGLEHAGPAKEQESHEACP